MNTKGFTILEVILAIFILTTAAFGSFNLIQQVIIAGSLNQSRLTAYYFAQEAIENIKNIRDTNYVQGNDWNAGIANSPLTVIKFLDDTDSRFSRQIDVSSGLDSSGNSYQEIKVTVQWLERGREHNIQVVNHLYNWFYD
jgi:Tfp pilus assembly protein PilV